MFNLGRCQTHAVIDPALCHGCGTRVSEYPGKAIRLKHFTDEQLIAKTAALFALHRPFRSNYFTNS
ncbi:MAG: hypothetical protein HZB87_13110 [Desulfatitalea sp.]|nr:hypothetical protein [Desulfatitalea sp.]